MFCQKCGKQLPDDAAFCTYCGAKIVFVNGNNTVNDNNSSLSGEQTLEETPKESISDVAKNSFPNEETSSNNIDKKPPVANSSKKKILIIICIIAACVAAAIIALFAIKGGKKQESNANTNTNAKTNTAASSLLNKNSNTATNSGSNATASLNKKSDTPSSTVDSKVPESKVTIGKTMQLNAGRYVGGADLPAGHYTLECKPDNNNSGIVWVSAPEDNLDNDYPSLLYKYVSANEEKTVFVPLRENGILKLPFPATITAVDYLNTDLKNPIEIYEGTYWGGKDLPVGQYNIICKPTGSDSGIVWASAPSDNLKEDYPSLLYKFIGSNEQGSFFISLDEGGQLKLPFGATISAVDVKNADFSNPVELKGGVYLCGKDIPAGKYNMVTKPDGNGGGIFWASAPNDNLKENYPSLLYKYVSADEEKTFFVSLEEGGKLNLPFSAILSNAEL